jgi:hypothetical protein
MTSAPLRPVRGDATVEEIAAVLAALDGALRASAPVAPSGYERWRQTRLTALQARGQARPATARAC